MPINEGLMSYRGIFLRIVINDCRLLISGLSIPVTLLLSVKIFPAVVVK